MYSRLQWDRLQSRAKHWRLPTEMMELREAPMAASPLVYSEE